MTHACHRSQFSEANVDMTPMLDIVFIMLIFFIVTTSFTKEPSLSFDRPAQTETRIVDQPLAFSIKIDEQGMPYVNGRQIDVERVVANVQLFLAENNVEKAMVQAHPKTRHGDVVKVVNSIKQAGINRVSVLVEK